MTTHSSILAWRTPWTEEPGGLYGVTETQTRLKQLSTAQLFWYYDLCYQETSSKGWDVKVTSVL